MYLDIISHFSSYCCFTYVKGLKKLDDILLKWLAEYTRLHPWRFVYLEGVDTSFNFPENRDRCNFRFAPANPLHSVRSMDDLKKLEVSQVRPSHFVSYAARTQPAEELQDSRRLLAFFAKNFAPDSSTGSLAADAMHQDTMFSQSPPASSYSPDFRRELEDLLFGPLPCMILLVSAPGAGKTHHMSALRGRLEEEMQFDIHEFDGSSDILVTTALAEVLQRTMTSQSMQSQKLLILDEYHMLSDEHKDELFEWVRAKLGSELRVVLIANRSDSKDRERLEQIRPTGASQVKVALLQTRLSRLRIQQVMESRGNAERWRPAICDWLVASRLLFGEESVSLRLCDTLEALLETPEPRGALIELLLHRVPTVSRTSAVDFVDAYLQHEGFRRKTAFGNTLLGFCFRVAMQDVQSDELCSFVEFLSLTPKAHEAPPAVRLLAWACYVMNAKKTWDLNGLAAMWSKRHLFVDQVNFPFELAEEALGYPTGSGPTFSWAGDPSSMRDLVDAVRRGHSVDWAEVHRKVWSVEHIKDSELFAQLLSLSRNPGMILQQVLPSNLCSLLRLSNTAAPTAVQLARIILRNAPVDSNTSSQVDRPRCLSLWTVILHDQQDLNCVEVLRLAGGPSALLEALLWARDWATERRSTAQAQARTRLLQQLLALMSCCCRSPIGANSTNECKLPLHQLILLWTGSFGCLLKAATPQQEKVWKKRELESGGAMSAEFLVRGDLPPALPQKRLCEVLQRVADVQADWPQEVRLLWRVLHSRSTAREVSKLWVAAPYMLQDTSSEAESAPIHEIFIPGVAAASGTLSRSLQRCLLCNSCQVPQKVSAASFVAACADALNELRNADQLREVQVAGPGGAAIQRLVREEQER